LKSLFIKHDIVELLKDPRQYLSIFRLNQYLCDKKDVHFIYHCSDFKQRISPCVIFECGIDLNNLKINLLYQDIFDKIVVQIEHRISINKRCNSSFACLDNILLYIDHHFELLPAINVVIQIYQVFHWAIVYSHYLFNEYIEYS